MPSYFGQLYERAKKGIAAQEQIPYTEAAAYRAALEKAAYGDAGREYGGGLDQITRQLAGMGPMADSGGATALRANLYSKVYGAARSRVGAGYADFLGQSLQARRRHLYQMQLQKLANKQNKRGFLETVTGAVGGVLGARGPGRAATGPAYQASDAYYG